MQRTFEVVLGITPSQLQTIRDYISYKIKSTKRDSIDIAIKIETYETT